MAGERLDGELSGRGDDNPSSRAGTVCGLRETDDLSAEGATDFHPYTYNERVQFGRADGGADVPPSSTFWTSAATTS